MINYLLKEMMLENVILIDAPRIVVWNVTIDIERWPQWTPTVTSVKRLDEGPFNRGSSALIKQPGLPNAKWIVTSLTPGEQFTWESRVWGIRMIATHELSTREGATQSTLRIKMSGVVARLLWPLIWYSARRFLEQENQGLNAKCKPSAPR